MFIFKAQQESEISISKESVPETSQGDAQSLFNILPQPSRKQPEVLEEDDEFLHKKATVTHVKPKAKITVPSLHDVSSAAININT